jgi:hypothetical protein
MLASMGSSYLGRIGIYTGATTIIGYGHLLLLIKEERSRNLTVFLVLGVLFVYWLYSVYAGKIGQFQWIFSSL